MVTTSPYAPFIRKWDGWDHYHFIHWAYNYYSHAKKETRYYFSSQAAKTLSWSAWRERQRYDFFDVALRIWTTGRKHHVVDADFWAFWEKLDPTHRDTYNGDYHRRVYKRRNRYEDFYPRNGAHFRCKVPLQITEKKELSEEVSQYREWRESKGFRRDHSKNGRRRPYKKWAKHFDNRCFRRHEKQQVQTSKYDRLWKYKRKDYFDPWS